MGNPNIAEAGRATRIKPGQRLPGAGRRPKKFNRFCKDEKLSYEDVQQIATWIMSLSREQIQAEINKPGQTLLIVSLLTAVLFDLKNHKKDTIVELINRTAGLPKQSVDVKQVGARAIVVYTPEERRKRIAELEAKRRASERENEKPNTGTGGDASADSHTV